MSEKRYQIGGDGWGTSRRLENRRRIPDNPILVKNSSAPSPSSASPPAQQGPRGVVAAGHPATAQAACHVLEAGGNAFDATLAALLAACVAEPILASLGGGGFLLAHSGAGEQILYDFFTQTPRQRREGEVDFYPIEGDFGGTTQEFHIGYGSVACPGIVKGLFEVHRDLGSLPFAELAEPAVRLARDGVEVNSFQAYIQKVLAPILRSTPESRALFQWNEQEGRSMPVGTLFRSPDLADFLEALTSEGEDLFYRGEVGRRLARASIEGGGHLTLEDLEGYRVERRSPLLFRHAGAEIATNPAPSSGGTLIAFCLELLDSVAAELGAFGSRAHLHPLVEAMALTNQARRRLAGEPGASLEPLLERPILDEYRRTLLQHRASTRGTTQISVADGAGNLASLTLSNGEGSGIVLPGTGILLNNMLGEEDLNPGGFHTWPRDRRLSSMMAPTVLTSDDGRRVALGSGGSNRLRTAIVQVMVNFLDLSLPLEDAVLRPRLHFENGRLHIEPGLPADAVRSLQEAYPDHRLWPEPNLFFGGVHAAGLGPAPATFFGGSDSRRGGVTRFVG